MCVSDNLLVSQMLKEEKHRRNRRKYILFPLWKKETKGNLLCIIKVKLKYKIFYVFILMTLCLAYRILEKNVK